MTAEELSKLTGESMTTAVTIALRERLDRIRHEQGLSLADRLLAIGRDCAARLKEPFRSADHGGLIYDIVRCFERIDKSNSRQFKAILEVPLHRRTPVSAASPFCAR